MGVVLHPRRLKASTIQFKGNVLTRLAVGTNICAQRRNRLLQQGIVLTNGTLRV